MPHERFNPPPNWPVPQGWTPPPGWEPDPSWPPAPPGWQFFVDESAPEYTLGNSQLPGEYAAGRGAAVPPPLRTIRWNVRWLAIAVVAAISVVSLGAYLYHRTNQPDEVILKPVDAQGGLKSGWVQDTSRSSDHIDCSFGSPSPYDKSAVVRECGATADSGDACWPAADNAHVQCLLDPFTNVIYLIGAQGLSTPRKALTNDPVPFALVLDDGTQCRVRIGGAWSRPQEHPDWVGYYSCKPDTAVWGPLDNGINKGFGGWTVQIGAIDGSGHLTEHKVAKTYYVAVAEPGSTGDDNQNGSQGGTRLVTKCGRTPQFVPEAIRSDSGGLVIRMKIVALCPGGDVLISPQTQISVTSDGQNVASGVFDLSSSPIVIAPGSGSGSSSASVEHDFRFPLGTFWRLPVSTNEAPTNGASQQGAVDLDAKTLVVACQESGSTTTTAQAGGSTAGSTSESSASGAAPPPSGDNESSSFDALRAIANSDRPYVLSNLADRWVPQLSSKRPGIVDDGITWDNAATLREHLQLRLKYPEVRLLWTGDWSVFSAPDFWVTIAGVTFPDADGALAWCRDHNLDRDHCYAKLVSTTHPVDDSTAFNP